MRINKRLCNITDSIYFNSDDVEPHVLVQRFSHLTLGRFIGNYIKLTRNKHLTSKSSKELKKFLLRVPLHIIVSNLIRYKYRIMCKKFCQERLSDSDEIYAEIANYIDSVISSPITQCFQIVSRTIKGDLVQERFVWCPENLLQMDIVIERTVATINHKGEVIIPSRYLQVTLTTSNASIDLVTDGLKVYEGDDDLYMSKNDLIILQNPLRSVADIFIFLHELMHKFLAKEKNSSSNNPEIDSARKKINGSHGAAATKTPLTSSEESALLHDEQFTSELALERCFDLFKDLGIDTRMFAESCLASYVVTVEQYNQRFENL